MRYAIEVRGLTKSYRGKTAVNGPVSYTHLVKSVKAQILAVQRMQDYIEAHLEQEITLSHLAKESLYSPWYSRRLFQTYTGSTPAEYIRRLRLSKSARRLKNERDVYKRQVLNCPWCPAGRTPPWTQLPVIFTGNLVSRRGNR